MSKLRSEIQALLRSVTFRPDGSLTAEIAFPRTFIGFQGHFPDRPVLPGVCKLLCVLVLLEVAMRKEARLSRVLLAKFLAPVVPDETLSLRLTLEDQDAPSGGVKALLFSSQKKIAEIHLEVTYV